MKNHHIKLHKAY